MGIKTIIKSFIISTLFIYVILIAEKVYSDSLEISGNASGLNNSININQKESNTVNQSNSAGVENSVNTASDTGGNSINDGVGGGSIKAGDATSNVKINNQFNTNKADVNCKNCSTPTPTPKPFPTPTSQIGGPTSNPTLVPSKSGENGGDGEATGESLAGDPGQAKAVLGLSATSGEKSLLQMLPGLLSIAFGFNFIRRSVKT